MIQKEFMWVTGSYSFKWISINNLLNEDSIHCSLSATPTDDNQGLCDLFSLEDKRGDMETKIEPHPSSESDCSCSTEGSVSHCSVLVSPAGGANREGEHMTQTGLFYIGTHLQLTKSDNACKQFSKWLIWLCTLCCLGLRLQSKISHIKCFYFLM